VPRPVAPATRRRGLARTLADRRCAANVRPRERILPHCRPASVADGAAVRNGEGRYAVVSMKAGSRRWVVVVHGL
jgi:hypothetical protein